MRDNTFTHVSAGIVDSKKPLVRKRKNALFATYSTAREMIKKSEKFWKFGQYGNPSLTNPRFEALPDGR
jgi:hypothetical protein